MEENYKSIGVVCGCKESDGRRMLREIASQAAGTLIGYSRTSERAHRAGHFCWTAAVREFRSASSAAQESGGARSA